MGVIIVVVTATCLGARCVAARTKRHFPPADGQAKEIETKVPSSPSSTEDLEAGFLGGSSRQVRVPVYPQSCVGGCRLGRSRCRAGIGDSGKAGELEPEVNGIVEVADSCTCGAYLLQRHSNLGALFSPSHADASAVQTVAGVCSPSK